MSRLKNIVKRSKSHKVLIENFSYLAFLQVFLLLYPLITYPYLVDVLGKEIYGIVLTAQLVMLLSLLILVQILFVQNTFLLIEIIKPSYQRF